MIIINDDDVFAICRLMSGGKAAQRDIVQFVPYRKFKNVRLVLTLMKKYHVLYVIKKINAMVIITICSSYPIDSQGFPIDE